MIELSPGWTMQVERGPDWLFVKLHGPAAEDLGAAPLAEGLWSLLQQHFTTRLVLELEQLPVLPSDVIGQLVLLQERLRLHGGLLRICGLSDHHEEALRAAQPDSRFSIYPDRRAALLGTSRPNKPR